MIESQFGYRKGYTPGSDASNQATIALLKLIPKSSFMHSDCYCEECAPNWHEREERFDFIKKTIEDCMVIAYQEGKKAHLSE